MWERLRLCGAQALLVATLCMTVAAWGQDESQQSVSEGVAEALEGAGDIPEVSAETFESPDAIPQDPAAAQDDIPPSEGEDPVMTDIGAALDNLDRGVAQPAESRDGLPRIDPLQGISVYVLRFVVVLCCVIALILVFYAALKKWWPHSSFLPDPTLAKVMGKVHLERGVTLHFVRSGGKVLVLGVGNDAITLITEYDSSEFEMARGVETDDDEGDSPVEPERFMEELRASRDVIAGVEPSEDDEIGALKGDIQRLQQYLRESAGDLET